MHDIRFIREHPEAFDRGLARRGLSPLAAEILEVDRRRRAVQTDAQELLKKRNDASRAIGQAKGKGEDASAAMAEVARLKDAIAAVELSLIHI